MCVDYHIMKKLAGLFFRYLQINCDLLYHLFFLIRIYKLSKSDSTVSASAVHKQILEKIRFIKCHLYVSPAHMKEGIHPLFPASVHFLIGIVQSKFCQRSAQCLHIAKMPGNGLCGTANLLRNTFDVQAGIPIPDQFPQGGFQYGFFWDLCPRQYLTFSKNVFI